MTPKQLHDTKEHYLDMFAMDLDSESEALLAGVDSVDELEEHREELSAGAFDAAEAILLGL